MSKRLSFEFVKNCFENEGYKLISNEYKNCDQKLQFECPNGHLHSISYDSFRRGSRCGECSKYKKKTIEEIKTETEKLTDGEYKCLSKNYANNRIHLTFLCPKGHRFKMSWGNFMTGYRRKGFIRNISEILISECALKSCNILNHGQCKNIWIIKKTHSIAFKICEYLYNDSTVYLERKYRNYKKYCTILNGRN